MADAAASAVVPANGLSPLQNEVLRRADAIFDSIGSTVSKASDLAMQGGKAVAEQIPDIAWQYVAYGRAFKAVFVLIGLALLIFGIWLAVKYGFKNAQEASDKYGDWAGSRCCAVFFGALSAFVGFAIFLGNLKGFILVWFAPKVWLILEIVELVKLVRS